MADTLTDAEHKARHEQLHASLEELMADFIVHTGKLPGQTTIMELLTWSYRQTQRPDPSP